MVPASAKVAGAASQCGGFAGGVVALERVPSDARIFAQGVVDHAPHERVGGVGDHEAIFGQLRQQLLECF